MEKINNSIIRNEAGKDGLILGLVTILFMLASQFAGKIDSPALTGVLGFFLWLAKFLGCIFLMRFFMKKLVAGYDGVIGADTFRLGVWIALFSALILSAPFGISETTEPSNTAPIASASSFPASLSSSGS